MHKIKLDIFDMQPYGFLFNLSFTMFLGISSFQLYTNSLRSLIFKSSVQYKSMKIPSIKAICPSNYRYLSTAYQWLGLIYPLNHNIFY